MKNTKLQPIPFRRKRKGLTDYKKRIRMLMSSKPRLVVRKGSKKIVAQIVEYGEKGDVIRAAATSIELKKKGWNYNPGNIASAYLTGLTIGKKAMKNGVKEAILDIGLYTPKKGSKIFAVLKGAVDAGLTIPHSEDKLPDEKRIRGEHIAEHASKIKNDEKTYQKRFSGYSKSNTDPSKITSKFDEVKNTILKGN